MKKLAVLAFVLVGCSSAPKKPPPGASEGEQAQFDQGLHALDAQEYREAARIFDSLLLQKPGSQLDLVTTFNSGSAYEGMGDCQKAADRFRQVVRSSAGKFSKIESEALFRLSLMYECLGQDNKTITALLDAKRRSKDLPFETVSAEIPARLAAAYSRIGNHARAMEYFTLASRGLKSIVSRGGSRVPIELIAKTLFLMGKLSPAQRRAEVPANTYMQSLAMQQPYLLQAIEIHHEPYSSKAEDDLQTAYENIWKFKLGDEEAQRDFYTRGLQLAAELKKIRMPKPDGAMDSVFSLVDQTQRRLQTELSKVAETNHLTPEAQKREGLRRQGRLVDPKNSQDAVAK